MLLCCLSLKLQWMPYDTKRNLRNRKSQQFISTKAKSFSMIRNKLLPSASVTRFVYDVNSNLINFSSQIVLQFAFCLSKTIHLDSDMLPDADTPCHIIMVQILNLKCKQCLQPCLAWVSEHHYRSNYERSTNSTSKLDWLSILVLFQTIYQQLKSDSEKLLVHSSNIRTLKQFKLFLFTQEKIISFEGNLWPSMNGCAHTQNFSSECEEREQIQFTRVNEKASSHPHQRYVG